MKLFKISDACLSLAMLILFSIENARTYSIDKAIESYFIAGGWQSISMLVHALNSWHTRKGGTRYVYHWIAFISVITMPIGSIWILYVLAPVMALFYTILCFVEIVHREKRPSELLGK